MGHRADRNETLERGFESGAVYFISHITSFFHSLGAPLLRPVLLRRILLLGGPQGLEHGGSRPSLSILHLRRRSRSRNLLEGAPDLSPSGLQEAFHGNFLQDGQTR